MPPRARAIYEAFEKNKRDYKQISDWPKWWYLYPRIIGYNFDFFKRCFIITSQTLGSVVRAIREAFENNERVGEQNEPFVKHLRKKLVWAKKMNKITRMFIFVPLEARLQISIFGRFFKITSKAWATCRALMWRKKNEKIWKSPECWYLCRWVQGYKY